jgi:hypothetical protein
MSLDGVVEAHDLRAALRVAPAAGAIAHRALGSAHSFAGSDLACRSFTDLLLYSMLQALPNNYSERLKRGRPGPECRGRCGALRSIFVAMPRS